MRKSKNTIVAGLMLAFFLAPALSAAAQQHTDEPNLSPMLFGETQKERREKIRKERSQIEEAREISVEQSVPPGQTTDEPRLSPLLFGPGADEREADRTATRIQLRDDEEARGFFSALNFLVPEETNLSLGIGPEYQPDYLGSDDYELTADPQVYIRVKNFVFLDDDGADLALLGFSRFRIGPSIRIRGRRDQDDNPALQGLGDVGTTFEFGGFISTTFLDRFNAKARARHGLRTGHRGTVVDGTMTALLFRTNALSLAASAKATWVGNRYADAFFSVTPLQSARSQGVLPVYEADAGFQDIGASVTAYINILDRWSLNPYANYSYILDDFARTPIIDQFGDREQITIGFHIMREFSFKMK